MTTRTVEERADMIYCVLATIAHFQSRPITYEELGDLTGLNHRRMGDALEMVARYCERRNLPKLTSLVVRKDSGLPSWGSATFRDVDNVGELQREVYDFNWRTFKERAA